MKTRNAFLKFGLPVLAATCLSLSVRGGDEATVDTSQLPEAAAKAIKAHQGDAKIVKIQKETDEGKVAYEAELDAAGKKREVSVNADGKLLSVETVISEAEAPEAVQATVQTQAGNGKVEKLERIDEGGAVKYEALISNRRKREEVEIAPDGKVLAMEKKGGRQEKEDAKGEQADKD